jgi:hypothetical protein
MGNDPDIEDSKVYPSNKDELCNRIEYEWSKLMDVIQPLDEMEMTMRPAGGWSIKDNLAHISVWEHYMCEHHIGKAPPHEALGMDAESYAKADEDGINDFLFLKIKDLTLSQVQSELHRTHKAMLSVLEQLSYKELMKSRDRNNPKEGPLLKWVVGNTYEHYKEHRLSIEKFIKESFH